MGDKIGGDTIRDSYYSCGLVNLIIVNNKNQENIARVIKNSTLDHKPLHPIKKEEEPTIDEIKAKLWELGLTAETDNGVSKKIEDLLDNHKKELIKEIEKMKIDKTGVSDYKDISEMGRGYRTAIDDVINKLR